MATRLFTFFFQFPLAYQWIYSLIFHNFEDFYRANSKAVSFAERHFDEKCVQRARGRDAKQELNVLQHAHLINSDPFIMSAYITIIIFKDISETVSVASICCSLYSCTRACFCVCVRVCVYTWIYGAPLLSVFSLANKRIYENLSLH